MTDDWTAKLRAPFSPDQIGKLPRVTCGSCRKSPSKVCNDHKKDRCKDCLNWITTAHMHLDYVGHASVTDRLLSADPAWYWEPMGLTTEGLPQHDRLGGLWIRLTVQGVTRIGYGDAQGKEGGDAVKEAIGDALRNAAMRFGVALDLWSKTPLDDHDTGTTIGTGQPKVAPKDKFGGTDPAEILPRLRADCEAMGWDPHVVGALFESEHGKTLKDCTDATLINKFWKNLGSRSDDELKVKVAAGVGK